MPKLLYYPSIVPPPQVIHQAVLYWDGFGSVAPDISRMRRWLPDELLELRSMGLYRLLTIPEEVLDEGGPAAAVLRDELRQLASAGAPTTPPDSFIYLGKLGSWVVDELTTLGLATPSRNVQYGGPVIRVGRDVEELVLGVAAQELARHWSYEGHPYFAYTSSEEAYRRALRPAPGEPASPGWQMEIGKLLPVPPPDTPLADVLRFRERYADERGRLMRALHALLDGLRSSWEHPSDVLEQYRDALAQASRDYAAAYKSRWTVGASDSIALTVQAAVPLTWGATGLPPLAMAPVVVIPGMVAMWVRMRAAPAVDAAGAGDFAYLHRVRTTFG